MVLPIFLCLIPGPPVRSQGLEAFTAFITVEHEAWEETPHGLDAIGNRALRHHNGRLEPELLSHHEPRPPVTAKVSRHDIVRPVETSVGIGLVLDDLGVPL